jgi:G3E family GTPase
VASAVIVNEFGEIGIDDALLREASDATVLLGNGCLCCRASSDVEAALRGLFLDRARGSIQSFARVIMETSGLADPGPNPADLHDGRGLNEMFGLQQVVAVIDAVTGAAALAAMPEARRQIALADRVMVTKADLAAPANLEQLREAVRAVNAAASATVADHGRIAAEQIVGGTLITTL